MLTALCRPWIGSASNLLMRLVCGSNRLCEICSGRSPEPLQVLCMCICYAFHVRICRSGRRFLPLFGRCAVFPLGFQLSADVSELQLGREGTPRRGRRALELSLQRDAALPALTQLLPRCCQLLLRWHQRLLCKLRSLCLRISRRPHLCQLSFMSFTCATSVQHHVVHTQNVQCKSNPVRSFCDISPIIACLAPRTLMNWCCDGIRSVRRSPLFGAYTLNLLSVLPLVVHLPYNFARERESRHDDPSRVYCNNCWDPLLVAHAPKHSDSAVSRIGAPSCLIREKHTLPCNGRTLTESWTLSKLYTPKTLHKLAGKYTPASAASRACCSSNGPGP